MKRYDNLFSIYEFIECEEGDWVKYEDAQAAIQEAVLAEREACAKLAENTYEATEYEATEGGGEDYSVVACYGENSAEAIRSRSQK